MVTAAQPPDPSHTLATARLSLVVLDAALIAAGCDGSWRGAPFVVPDWWPDGEDRDHVAIWRSREAAFRGHEAWRPRALVDASGMMVGHAGFHLPPRPLAEALADPSFTGTVDEVGGGAVEVGYTVFPASRGQGLATEAVGALTRWALGPGGAGAVLASVAESNAASLKVLDKVGGFTQIGTCVDEDGTVELLFSRRR